MQELFEQDVRGIHDRQIDPDEIQDYLARENPAPACEKNKCQRYQNHHAVELQNCHQLAEGAPPEKIPVPLVKKAIHRAEQQENNQHRIMQRFASPVIVPCKAKVGRNPIGDRYANHVNQPQAIDLNDSVLLIHSYLSYRFAGSVLPSIFGRYRAAINSA